MPHPSIVSLHDFVGVLQLVFASVAGAGALVALVMAYRRQRVAETATAYDRTRVLNERFTTIADQFGHDRPAVRLAGVNAMAGLADDWEENRQTCVDVLCAYLRLPYEADPGNDASAAGRLAYRANREVRHTVIRLIATHLREVAPVSWQGLNFDFTGVVFDGGSSFGSAQFSGGVVSFVGAEFANGTVGFSYVGFSGGTVNFTSAKFSGSRVDFGGAVFSGGTVNFTSAKFSGGTVDFTDTEFSGGRVDFDAEFSDGRVNFTGAEFFLGSTVHFDAVFSGGVVDFTGAEFKGGLVTFNGAEFKGGTVDFSQAGWQEAWESRPTFGWDTYDPHTGALTEEGTPPPGVKLPPAATTEA